MKKQNIDTVRLGAFDVIRKRWAEFVHGEGYDWQKLTPKIDA